MNTASANKQRVADYFERVWNAHDVSALDDFVATDFIQHNPALGDGRAALAAFLDGLFAALPAGRFEVRRLVAEGDLVVAHSLFRAGADDARGTAVVDIFRLHDGWLVEHWDLKEAVPAAVANSNGMV